MPRCARHVCRIGWKRASEKPDVIRENSIGERRNALRVLRPSSVYHASLPSASFHRYADIVCAAIDELRGDDAAGADRLALDVARLVEDGEAVAAPQVLQEVDVAREELGERDGDRVGQSDRVRRGEQRARDLGRW